MLDHYPVRSIKDIDSPWKRKIFRIAGVQLSLNDIENKIIRKNWDEPRIHFALNCASISCPPLRAEAYTGPALDAQLEQQTVTFLADEAFNFVDEKGRLRLSKIFRWYKNDFESDHRSVVDWVRPYMPALQELDPSRKVKIKHGDYDCNLNEATNEING